MIEKLILGTVQFGLKYGINNTKGKPNSDEIQGILSKAFSGGIKYLDSAESYGTALNEIRLFHDRNPNKRFEIINKFRSEDLKSENGNIYKEKYFALLLHNINDLNDSSIITRIIKLKSDNKINKIGASIYDNEQFKRVIKIEEIDIIQIPFNLLDNSQQRLDLIRLAKSKGKIIHTRSVFLQGLFFVNDIPEKLIEIKPYLLRLKQLSNEYNTTLTEMALQYALSINEIDAVIIGVDNIEQLISNMEIAKNIIDKDLKKEIDKINVAQLNLLNPINWK
jgi:aryl-alcohol dehydrogenase-like predicted oxidoreductase